MVDEALASVTVIDRAEIERVQASCNLAYCVRCKCACAKHLILLAKRTCGYVRKAPAREVLGLAERDRYWLHMFDSVALALEARAGST